MMKFMKKTVFSSKIWSFSNFKRLYRKKQEELEHAIPLKRCAKVSTFERTSIQDSRIKIYKTVHTFVKKSQKGVVEGGL